MTIEYALNPKKNDLGNNISTHFAYYFEDESTFYFEAMRMGTITRTIRLL